MANRTVLLSVDFETAFDRFGDQAAGTWQSTIAKTLVDRDASFWGDMGGTWADDLAFGPLVVGSVKDRDAYYPQVSTLENLADPSLDNGFFYDPGLQIVYVKFKERTPWYTRELLDYGNSLRYLDQAQQDPDIQIPVRTSIDGVFAEPRVVPDSFAYRQTADPIGGNRMTFDDSTITLINTDGALDNVREQTIGRAMRVYLASLPDREIATSLSQFEQVFEGRVKTVTARGGDVISIRGGDPRGFWTSRVSASPLTVAEYPDMDPKLENKFKPFISGTVLRAPCINVSTEGNNRTWVVNDPVNDPLEQNVVLAAYDDTNDDRDDPINPAQWDYFPATGTIVLNSDPRGTVRVDIDGQGVISPILGPPDTYSKNAVDLVVRALELFAGLAFIDDFWDTEEVDLMRSRSFDVGIRIGEDGGKLKDLVDLVCASANLRIFFKALPDNQGSPRIKYSMRDLEITGLEPTVEVKSEDMLALPASWSYDERAQFSSIAINYAEKVYDGIFDTYRDNSRETEALLNTPVLDEYEFDTVLVEEADAITVASKRYDEAVLAPYVIQGTLATEVDFNLLDYVRYTHQRDGGVRILNPATWRVVGVDKIARTFSLLLIEEDEDKTLFEFTGRNYTPFVMYGDTMYGEIDGELVVQ